MSQIMDKIVSENLFLLEFLVDKCIVLPCAISKEISQVAGETCVCFKFLDNDPLDICEEDFSPKRDYTDDGNMKSGKSCLFALSPSQAEEALTQFDVEVCVFKKLTNGVLPDKVQIGTSIVPIVTIFNELIQLLQAAVEPGTVSRTLKDCYNVNNINNEVIGSITVFIRMSCFGKLIVTQFQMNLEDKSVFFKDKEGRSLYKYRKASRAEVKGQEEGTGTGTVSANKCKPLRPISYDKSRASDVYPSNQEQFNSFDGQCADCSPEMTPYGGEQYGEMVPARNSLSEKGNYQEIGAEMNGNSLTIRVHKNKGTVKRIDGDDTETFMSEDKYGKGYNDPCSCLGDKSFKQQTRSGANPCYCLKPTSRNPPCMDKQVLSLRPADDPNNPFAFRVSGCPNNVNNNVTVVSPTNTRPDGMQVTEISDPNKDVFILRIGKKSEGTEKKANLELELVTPKGVDKKPIPKKETRETQYLESDAGPESDKGKGKGKGGKKGKGDKGKKGKKGKKGGGDVGGDDNEGQRVGSKGTRGSAGAGAGRGANATGGPVGGASAGAAGGAAEGAAAGAAGSRAVGGAGSVSGAGGANASSGGVRAGGASGGGASGAGGPGNKAGKDGTVGKNGKDGKSGTAGKDAKDGKNDKNSAADAKNKSRGGAAGGGGGGGGGFIGIGMKADRQHRSSETCCRACPPCAWCLPCCCRCQTAPSCYQCWCVPSNTNLKCSLGKIKSVCCNCYP